MAGSVQILIVSLSNIGDVVLTTPVIQTAAETFPGAGITVVAGPRAAEVLTRSRAVERVVVYDKRVSWLQKMAFIRKLRDRRYDWTIDLRNTLIPFLVSTRRRSPLVRRFQRTRMRDRHLEVLAMSGFPAAAPATTFEFFNEQDRLSLEQKMRERGLESTSPILVAASSRGPAKRWPLEKFRAVIRALGRRCPAPILLVGDGAESRTMHPLAAEGSVHNFAGLTSLAETAALVARCRLLVTNDSAVMHLAHEYRRPVVELFGASDPARYGGEGPNVRVLAAGCTAEDIRRAQRTSVPPPAFTAMDEQRVVAACFELLEKTGR